MQHSSNSNLPTDRPTDCDRAAKLQRLQRLHRECKDDLRDAHDDLRHIAAGAKLYGVNVEQLAAIGELINSRREALIATEQLINELRA